MTENYNPQGSAPNPYNNSNRYGTPVTPVHPAPSPYYDPNQNQSEYPPAASNVAPGGGQQFSAYPPAQNPNYAPAQPWGTDPRVADANRQATISLVLGIVSFFFLGLFLSIPGYYIAKRAELVNGQNAKAARIVNLVSIGVSAAAGLLFVFVFLLSIAANSST